MNEPKMWRLGGVLFLVAAALMFVNDNVAMASAFLVIGVLFIVMPQYTESRRNKKR